MVAMGKDRQQMMRVSMIYMMMDVDHFGLLRINSLAHLQDTVLSVSRGPRSATMTGPG